jgi:hypothetical protein
MRVVWKHPLVVTDDQIIYLPDGAEILTVQMQGETPTIWFLCDPDAPTVPREILIFGTAHAIRDDITTDRYIGTFQMYDGGLVFHVFEGDR